MKIKTITYLFILPILLTTLLLSNSINTCKAQKNIQNELPVLTNSSEFISIPIGLKGLLILEKVNKRDYVVHKYDKDLVSEWAEMGNIDKDAEYVNYSYDGKKVYLLFSTYFTNSYQIIRIGIEDGQLDKFQLFSIEKMEISGFKALNNAAFITGKMKNKDVILYASLINKKIKILPSALKNTAELQSIDLDTNHHTVSITHFVGNKVKEYQINIKTFNDAGELLTEINDQTDDEFGLMNGKIKYINDLNKIAIGTYGYKKYINDERKTSSQGVYFSKVDNHDNLETNYISFSELNNFYDYLEPKQKESADKKIAKQKKSGSDIKHNKLLFTHDIIYQDSLFILVAEIFEPEYSTNNNFGNIPSLFSSSRRWGFSPYGNYNPYSRYYFPNTQSSNNRNFEGYNYEFAIVVAFDKTGKIVWNESMPFYDVKEKLLTEKLKVGLQDQILTMAYTNDGNFYSKTVDLKNNVRQETKTPYDTQFEGDKVKSVENEALNNWYGNQFIYTGNQKIANKIVNEKRNVYSLKKIKF
ncbi:MAG: hypothetical protein KA327_03770 [Pseudarcicella sp.]|nr:hypothetical protein [Pseudarcicella sp.]